MIWRVEANQIGVVRAGILRITILLLFLSIAGCGERQKSEQLTPAGHPDELKDTTRLDPQEGDDETQPEEVDSNSTSSGENSPE